MIVTSTGTLCVHQDRTARGCEIRILFAVLGAGAGPARRVNAGECGTFAFRVQSNRDQHCTHAIHVDRFSREDSVWRRWPSGEVRLHIPSRARSGGRSRPRPHVRTSARAKRKNLHAPSGGGEGGRARNVPACVTVAVLKTPNGRLGHLPSRTHGWSVRSHFSRMRSSRMRRSCRISVRSCKRLSASCCSRPLNPEN